jgi:putative spermidine/putrescine transport system substrate-binding protein
MRSLLVALATAICAVVLGACGGGGDDKDSSGSGDSGSATGTITFSSFGGATTDNVNDIYLDPFAEERGLDVLNDTVDYGKLYSMVQNDNVTWDVVQGDGYFAKQACADGILEPLSDEVLQAVKDAGLPKDSYGKCYIQPWSYSWVLAYSTDLDPAPTSWAALTDPETYPGGRTLWSVDQLGIFEAAEMAAGTPKADIYPIDFDVVFSQLDKIKDDVVYTESLVDQAQEIISGRASMGILTSSRALEAEEAGEPIAIRWEDQVLTGDTFFVPKGTPNVDAAMAFMADMLDTDKLVKFAIANGYGPNGTAAQAALAEELPDCKNITTCEAYRDSAVRLDDDWWFQHREEATKQWEDWVGA